MLRHGQTRSHSQVYTHVGPHHDTVIISQQQAACSPQKDAEPQIEGLVPVVDLDGRRGEKASASHEIQLDPASRLSYPVSKSVDVLRKAGELQCRRKGVLGSGEGWGAAPEAQQLVAATFGAVAVAATTHQPGPP